MGLLNPLNRKRCKSKKPLALLQNQWLSNILSPPLQFQVIRNYNSEAQEHKQTAKEIIIYYVWKIISETKQSNFLKDTAMAKRLNDLNNLPDKDKEYIFYALDGLIKSAQLQAF